MARRGRRRRDRFLLLPGDEGAAQSAHAGYLLATAIFLLPPILGWLSPIQPGLSIAGPVDFGKFMIGFQLANGLPALVALGNGLRSRHGEPWFVASALQVLAALLFQTVGGWPAWGTFHARSAEIPVIRSRSPPGSRLSRSAGPGGWPGGGRHVEALPA